MIHPIYDLAPIPINIRHLTYHNCFGHHLSTTYEWLDGWLGRYQRQTSAMRRKEARTKKRQEAGWSSDFAGRQTR